MSSGARSDSSFSRAVRSTKLALFVAVTAYAAGFSALSILRHRSFETGRFDLGNMVQAVWATAHGRPLRVTDVHGEQISRLAAHVDPVLVVFAPFWRLWPSPSLLLVAQATLVALGALPVFWLARKHLANERAALGFALAYLLYPAVQWLTLNEFHPVALACPLLLFAFWYLDEQRLLAFAICAALAALTKEEIGLVVAGMGVWYAFSRRRWRSGLVIAGSGIAVSALAVGVVIPYFNDGDPSAFYGRYDEVGGSPSGILSTLLRDPGTLVATAFTADKLGYVVQMLAPLAGLPLLAPLALLAALPEFALNMLSSTSTQTSIHFHYTAAEIPPLVVAAVLGAAWIARSRARLAVPLGVLAVAVALVSNYRLGAVPVWGAIPGGESRESETFSISAHDRVASRALAVVPDDAVVS
ncbi:MAG: DUF2079 domain-containing protein, partial [Actinomycetota bacterium]|nr:DUF2079 domain-containing protein [Actinomycetota bacterium]